MSLRLSPLPLPLERRPVRFLSWAGTVPGRAVVLTANPAATALFLVGFTRHGVTLGRYRIDLDVYRIGCTVWWHGGNLYGHLPPTLAGVRLPFTYPPVAAVLLAPLALLPMAVAGTVLSVVTIALTAVVIRLFLRRLTTSGGSWRAVAWLLPAALLLEPVRNTLGYGQINVVLMAMVSADCLARPGRLAGGPGWPRGALVGLAAAVKLTPAAFVLFFLLRRDYRAARTAALSFAVATAAGFLLARADSVRYWTGVIAATGRFGNGAYPANQSIQAVLIRAGTGPGSPAGAALWLAVCAVVLVLAWHGMRHAVAAGQDAWALAVNAFAALLISPVSWSHHWV
jgi:alpha-1,2-mannosyltransferase